MINALKFFALVLLVSSPSLFAKETRANEDGKGNSIYLDRHTVSCGTKGMKSFRLFRPTKTTIAYQFHCGSKSMGKRIHKETRANDYGNGNVIYLDRHKVNCGKRALQSFRLIRPTKDTIAYAYQCSSENLQSVTSHETRANEDGKGNIVYLDRHKVNCGNRYLTGFKLFRPTNDTIAYKYTCGQ